VLARLSSRTHLTRALTSFGFRQVPPPSATPPPIGTMGHVGLVASLDIPPLLVHLQQKSEHEPTIIFRMFVRHRSHIAKLKVGYVMKMNTTTAFPELLTLPLLFDTLSTGILDI